jgi:hypothetical protein
MRSGEFFLSQATSLKGTKWSGIKSINPSLGKRESQFGNGLRPFYISRTKQQGLNVFIRTKGLSQKLAMG